MRLSTVFFTSLGGDPAEARMVSHKLVGMPTVVTVSPLSVPAGGVEVTNRSSGERSVRPMEDIEAKLRGAA